MDAQQTLVYECSRKNAQIQISNSEWTNIFNEPIELEKGDTVRMLGSFISEAGDGNDISITEDLEFTLNWSPYINADTVKFDSTSGASHTPHAAYQMKLGDIAQPAYLTDNFGVEPPYHPSSTDTPNTQANLESACLRDINTQYKDYSDSTAHYNYNNDIAVKMGCDIDTHSSGSALTAADYEKTAGSLYSFGGQNLEQEFKVAHMCKLIRFPIFKGILYRKPINNDNQQFTETFNNFDESEPILKTGDSIATYFNGPIWDIDNLGSTPRYYPYPGTNNEFGKPQYDKGPRSVVGTVIAHKDVYEDIYDPIANITRSCLFRYCYVQDFSNPGQYQHKNTESTYPRHGAPMKENGYNEYRNDNKVNGFTYNYYWDGDTKNCFYNQNYMYQLVSKRLLNKTGQNPGPINQTNLPFSPNSTPEENLYNQFNHNLSFLWSGMPSNTQPFNVGEGGDNGASDPAAAPGTMLNQFTSWVTWRDNLTGASLNVFLQEDITAASTSVKLDLTALDTLRQTGSILSGDIRLVNPTYCEAILNIDYVNGFVEVAISDPPNAPINGGTALNLEVNAGGWFWMPLSWRIHCYNDGGYMAQWITGQNDINEWIGCGGIYKVNTTNDNLTPHAPAVGKYNRCYIPYAHQKVESKYAARNFGTGSDNKIGSLSVLYQTGAATNPFPNQTPQARTRQIFGQSPGFILPGNVGVGNLPMPYCWSSFPAMNINNNQSGGGHHVVNPVCGSVYNEYCCSIHFQTDTGGVVPLQAGNQTQFENNVFWKSDLIYTKKYKTAFKVKKGFYSPEKFSDIINDQLHYSTEQYNEEIGKENTTVNGFDRALQSSNSVLHGNFIHTYLPDLSYGFFPLTPATFKVVPELQQYPYGFNTLNVNPYLHYYEDFGDLTPIQVPQALNGQNTYYIPPWSFSDNGMNTEITSLFRLIGGKQPRSTNTYSMDNQDPALLRNTRILDNLIDVGDTQYQNGQNPSSLQFCQIYQNRTYMNALTYGGSSKCFVGAVNPSFIFDEDKNRFSFEFLYTPYRPATDDQGTSLTMVSGQAVPSAIMDTDGTGGLTAELSGITITNLIGNQINNTNMIYSFPYTKNYPSPIVNYTSLSNKLWNDIGFSNTLLSSLNDDYLTNIYLFFNQENQLNPTVIRNFPEVNISVNGANPARSYCSLVAPPLQYTVQVDSNDFFGDRKPTLTESPFYLVGSNFPAKHYYGGQGTELPIFGICSRQFSSFGFVFDLADSSITYTVNENTKLSHITTRIYTNDYKIASNLNDDSSVVYIINKSNYYPQMPPDEIQDVEKIQLENQLLTMPYTPQQFYYTEPMVYEAPLFDTDSEED